MLKKLFMFFAIFMASVFTVCAQNCEGSYIGTLDVVKMNDKNYNAVENQEFTLKCDGLYKGSPIAAEVHYTGIKK